MASEDDKDNMTSARLELNQLHPKAVMWIPRIVGVITLVCGASMISMAWKRSDLLFHRLVLVMAIHLAILGITLIIGAAAIPESLSNSDELSESILGYHGTEATCTAQGFVFYVCFMASMMYYCSFSAYSYLGVPRNFVSQGFEVAGKYIHAFVNFFALVTAVAIVLLDGFNNTGLGFCGPARSDISTYKLFLMVPLMLEIVFSSVVMVLLYGKVKRNQAMIFINARSVARQATIYLAVLYWVVVPVLLSQCISWATNGGHGRSFMTFSVVNFSLFGLWSMLSYWYFSVEKRHHKKRRRGDDDTTDPTSTFFATERTQMDSMRGRSSNCIFSTKEFNSSRAKGESEAPNSQTRTQRFSFNIFDGTNASGMFASFVFSGDDEDEEADKLESDKWKDIQDHV
ncbi:unnamed protein product [Pseudo-nitzschia multistriata]|uniref:G-protein coupled receptors family 2 profile 2 domain-containing protein n=1 Tax=Pseudo-nitzschia multistriata TaxID=183589 RepID=A0A448ZPL5_9STRA|nr:unnamed protein product [Pseudo-nitzschia multistriata]